MLLDGTSNEIAADRTNILRLYGALEKSDTQIVYYDPGVGTLGPEGSAFWLKRKAAEVWGLMTGWGLDANVKQAYRFLMHNYDDGKCDGEQDRVRDEIHIFGFSRGAYSARVLAGFIHAVGLLDVRNENLLDYAYRAYKRVGIDGDANDFAEVRLYERILRADRPPIRFLGLFDTVASVIEHGRTGLRLKSHAFTNENRSVESVAHAVAIDDRRTMFTPQLWPAPAEYWGNPFNSADAKLQEIHEVWFAGSHGDVGGGHPEADSALAKVPLVWMIDRAKECGLTFKTRTINSVILGDKQSGVSRYVKPNPFARLNNSMSFGWALLEFIPRSKPKRSKRRSFLGLVVPFFERRGIPPNATLHRSVIDRMASDDYDPDNLPTDYEVSD
ncbi:DUF2235 domain-containing protein [Erythrobacter sp.]|uniref:DUF2235 domain-containing protein n=1 Tax=Erythrobacter sp. TaxID=1042 RepID=UPI003C73C270